MSNEAVIIELLGNGGDPVRYTVANNNTISKGTIVWLEDPRTISKSAIYSNVALDGKYVAGVVAHDKVGGDGSTSVSVYTNGIFDLVKPAGKTIAAGMPVVLSGQNLIAASTIYSHLSAASVVGIALEEGAEAGETIAVRIHK